MPASSQFWGDLILSLRMEQKLSQRQLSRMAQITRSTLRSVEEGRDSMELRHVEKLLDALGYEIDVFSKDIGILASLPPLDPRRSKKTMR